jgi:hypothetical protein
MNLAIRKCRFIAYIADLSALGGFSDISLHLLISIIMHTVDLSAFRGIHDILLYLSKYIMGLNRHQPKKNLSISVGARVDDVRLGGPLWSRMGGGTIWQKAPSNQKSKTP